jgi:hypothetical protein
MIPAGLMSRFMLIRGMSVFRVVYARVMGSAQARRATYAARRGTHPGFMPVLATLCGWVERYSTLSRQFAASPSARVGV